MNVRPLAIPDVRLLQPRLFRDARGSFAEVWSRERYAEAGVPTEFVQDNVSRSRRGVVRGLHFQHPRGQGKLISVLDGEVFDVAVDVRVGSETFGRWVGQHLSSETGEQLWIPAGFAHGFMVLSGWAVFSYKCTDYYAPDAERTVRWDDPELAIGWPAVDPVLSGKDRDAPRLAELPREHLPRAGAGLRAMGT